MSLRARQRGFLLAPYRFATGPAADPHWANVVALLHFDELPVIDETGKTGYGFWSTPSLNATARFGASSLYTTGITTNPRAFSSPTSSDFVLGTGDFTIEFWLRPVNGGAGQNYGRLFQMGGDGADGGLWIVREVAPNPLKLLVQVRSGSYRDVIPPPFSGSIPNDTWTHVALTRASGVWRIFLAGVLVGENSDTGAGTNLTANVFRLGANVAGEERFQGFFDELRITKGVARYTANFTAPGAAFPNS